MTDIRLRNDYFVEDIWVIDLKHASFAHVLRLNPVIMQKAANLFHVSISKLLLLHLILSNCIMITVSAPCLIVILFGHSIIF